MTTTPLRDLPLIAALVVGWIVLALLTLMLTSCSQSEVASCSIEQSELGLYGPDHVVGSTMTEDEARARMASEGITGWIEIHAQGDWDRAWTHATDRLGSEIHRQLAWLDVTGRIENLYAPDDAFDFAELTVSRSYQGKIEHDDRGLLIPIGAETNSATNPTCVITAVHVAEQDEPAQIDVLDAITP